MFFSFAPLRNQRRRVQGKQYLCSLTAALCNACLRCAKICSVGESIPERKRDVVLPEEGPQETLLRDPAAVISRSKAPDDSSSEDSMLDEDGASSEDLLDGVQASPDGLDEESVSR